MTRTPSSSSSWPTCVIPPIPEARGFESSATTKLYPRYEDIAQDGRVQLATVMPGLSAVWRSLQTSIGLDGLRQQRILPILRRIVIRGEEGPFSVHAPIHFSGTWRIARELDGERLFLDMWLEATAANASTLGPPPAADAPRVTVARVHAEHVFTRPFDPPATRKVTRLAVPGFPELPEDTHPFEEAEDLVRDHALGLGAEHTFGMMHTDSNQHVNSLVYPRLFEEAAIRALATRADIPSPEKLLMRAIELRYRKPFFAGDRAAIELEAAVATPPPSIHARVAVAGAFRPSGSAGSAGSASAQGNATKPSCTVAMWLG